MKIEIKIVGQVEDKNVKEVRGAVDKILTELFASFKFSWEMVKGADEK